MNVAPDLADRAAARLRSKILDAIGLARKSGDVVFGLHNVQHAIAKAPGGELLFEASDGKPEYRAQLAERLNERFTGRFADRSAEPGGLPVDGNGPAEMRQAGVKTITVFSAAELGLALGRDNVVHVWMKNQGLARRVCESLNKLYGLQPADAAGDLSKPGDLSEKADLETRRDGSGADRKNDRDKE